jgi:hypothetical protein
MTIRGNSWILCAGVVLYLACSFAFALTKSPGNDEGWFAAPAYNLATEGSLGMPVLEPTGSWLRADLTGIRQHTYWNMPLGMVVQGAWFRLFGFGLLPMRVLSILAGLVVLAAWYLIVLLLTQDRYAASCGFILLAIDYTFLWGAADGRPDMLCLAMGSAGLASYLALREMNLVTAMLVSNTLAATGVFIHPNGVMAMAGLAFLVLYFDVRRLNIRLLIVGTVPYVIGALGWLCYIGEAPSLFLAQFTANASVGSGSRWRVFLHPIETLYNELLLRYVAHFGMLPLWTDATTGWNVLIPAVYFASLVSAAFSGIRKHRGNCALIAFAVISFIILAANGLKLQFYLVYAIPAYAAVLGIWVRYMSQRPAIVFVAVLLTPLLYLQSRTIIHLTASDKYHRSYLPAMQYVKRNIHPGSVVVGNSTGVFALGFDHLVDDERLGYFSAIVPDIVIADRYYPLFWRNFRRDQPDVEEYVRQNISANYQPVFVNEYYTIYRRKTVSSFSASAVRTFKRNRLPSGERE